MPGLIEGAAEGAGLGIRVLKHVSRTRLLFHVVDMAPVDESDPIENVRAITEELGKYDEGLLAKERWLVFNKSDLLPPDEVEKTVQTWNVNNGVLRGACKYGAALTNLSPF